MEKYTEQGQRLQRFLEVSDFSQRSFATLVGSHQSIISRIKSGQIRPGIDLASRIEAATNGEFKPSDWAAVKSDPATSGVGQ